MNEVLSEFSLGDAPLDGWNLIEANAGTGKTYSITGLYLRLLLERDMETEEILVVTFTRAATSELKARLLSRLREAAVALDGGPADDLLAAVRERLADPQAARRRLQRAIRAFDLANIHTIHGFCQQLLNEFSFAVGFDPDVQLIEDEGILLDPLIQREWQRLSEGFSPPLAAYMAAGTRSGPAALRNTLSRLLDKPYAEIVTAEAVDTRVLEEEFSSRSRSLLQTWKNSSGRAVETLLSHPGLNRNRYREEQILAAAQALSALLADPWRRHKLADTVAKLGERTLQRGTNKGFEPPREPVFAEIDRYLEVFRELRGAYRTVEAGLPVMIYRGVRESLAAWKRQESVFTYRDLILDLDAALKSASRGAIVEAVGKRYRAALVDEFQDTDPIQFDIMESLFGAPGATVFLVGDPKQALYGFRGADVFAYLKARTRVQRSYQLTRDWRAAPALLAGLNRLFSSRDNPFVLPSIPFRPSTPAARGTDALQIDGAPAPPLVAWELPAAALKGHMRKDCAAAVAAEIEGLMANPERVRVQLAEGSTRPLRASDIAVLAYRHDQAAEIAAALNSIGIACVQPGSNSVFDSEEAEELERVLHGVHFPQLPGRMAGALSTRLLGAGAEDVAALAMDDEIFEGWVERFQGYRMLWDDAGVTTLVNTLIRDFGIPARLLPQVDGQRRLTNLFQLVELMEQHLSAELVTPGEQLEWLHLQRQSTEFPGEEALLRLESDDDLVTVLTIHKSKGLEFPVVFCPYLWDAASPPANPRRIEYHQGEEMRLRIDFGGPEREAALAQHLEEDFAERVRLTYVALTRARLRAYFAWGVGSGSGHSALAYLLGSEGRSWSQIAADYSGKKALAERRDESRRRLGELGITVAQPPARVPAAVGADRGQRFGRFLNPARQVETAWAMHSYSSLAGDRWAGPADYDFSPTGPGSDRSPGEAASIHDLPAGARTGLMVHEILEELIDFASPTAELIRRAGAKLEKFGFNSAFAVPLGEQLHRCLNTPLVSEPRGLCLAQVPGEDCVREMEFHFAVQKARLEGLWRLLRGEGSPPGRALIRGFVRGFVDLIFRFNNKYYIIDYKTNYLGNNDQSYGPGALREALMEHAYDLQYHLYALALHRHLRQRRADYSYAADFGGVMYLFVRGMSPASGPGRGVFFDCPAGATIDAMDELLKH